MQQDYGRSPTYLVQANNEYTAEGIGKLPAWRVENANVTYNPLKLLGLSLQVNNLFDKMPPIDHSYLGTIGQPYNQDNYNTFGRSKFLEANCKFDVN